MSRFHKTEFDFYPECAFLPRPGGGMTLEGGKGSSAPAPDPRLVDAQIQSMDKQNEMLDRIVGNSEQMAPLQKEQMQFALDASRQAWDQSQADREYALGRRDQLTGMQDTLISDAKNFNNEAKREELAGQAGAEVSAAYESAKRTQNAEMARMGVNPSDGRYGSMSNALSANTALASASAKNGARTAARAEGQALTDRATNALAGYPSMSSALSGAGQGFGAAGLGLANSGLAGLNSGYGQAGGMAGQIGSNATNMWGAQANYKNQQDQIANASDPFGTLLGAAGGVGTAWALNKFK